MRKFHTVSKLKRGSSTVEAAYLIPMLVMLTALLIYLSFFLYNRLILTEAAYISVLRGSRPEYKTAKECYRKTEESLNDLLSGKLLAQKEYEKKAEVTGTKVEVTLRIKQKLPFWKSQPEYHVKKSAARLNPYEFIRECRRFLK